MASERIEGLIASNWSGMSRLGLNDVLLHACLASSNSFGNASPRHRQVPSTPELCEVSQGKRRHDQYAASKECCYARRILLPEDSQLDIWMVTCRFARG